jgi:hypothetical protein
MAGITEIYTAILAGTQSVNVLTQGLLALPRPGGKVTAINNLTTSPATVIAASSARSNITFHNPGAATAYVAPLTVGSSGGTLTPSLTALGGCFEVLPGGWVTLAGTVQQGFQAFVSSGSSQPLTIMDQ